MNGLINFLILWGPTLLFILILATAIILGLLRGLRKSIILLIQSVVAFLICFITYLIIVNSPGTDAGVVSFVNVFMGTNGLQNAMGVTESCKGLKEILIEFIPKQLDFGDGLLLILQDNGAYLAALVNYAYHIIFAVIFGIVYLLLDFILYIIYQIFYPERKHKRKIEKKNAELETEKSYNKRKLFGGLVGLGRGLVGGLVCMSFLGSILYIFAGGVGEKKYDEYEFGNESTDSLYCVYQSVGEYGTNGIFKILNSVKNKDNVPYYLFAADIVFSGGLNDEGRGISTNIAFTEEIGAYTKFARDTFDIMMKYGADDIKPIILGEYEGDVMEAIVKVFAKEGFQEEFNKIVDEFDAKTYFVNFSLSLIDSIVNHLDELKIDGLSEDVVEVISILFKDGYLSDYIPEETIIKDKLETNPNYNFNSPAHLTASKLLTEGDTKSLLKSVLGLLSLGNTDSSGNELDDTQKVLMYSKNIIPHIKNLSIISNDRKTEVNPVLVRLYSYLENRYLNNLGQEESEPQLMSYYLADKTVDDFDWVNEIVCLLDVASEAIPLYERVYKADSEPLDMVFSIFDKSSENYTENVNSFSSIKASLSDSQLLGKVLSTNSIYKMVEDSLVGIAPEIYLPDDISYGNTYDDNGNLITNGELYQVLNALEYLLKNEELKPLVMKVYNEEIDFNDQNQMLEFANEAVKLLTMNNSEAVDYLLNSRVFESILSGFIISNKVIDENSGIELYIPDSVLQEHQGTKVNLINKEEIKAVINQLPGVLEIADGFLNIENPNYNSIDAALKNSVIDNLLNNIIVQGTLVNIIGTALTADGVKDFVSLPKDYVNADGKMNVEKWIENSELSSLVNGVRESGLELDKLIFMGELNQEQQQAVIMEQLKDKLNNNSFDTLLSSNVLHSVISNLLIDKEYSGIKIIVPNSVITDELISKSEIENILSQIPNIIPDDMSNQAGIITKIVENKDDLLASPTLLATIVNFINVELIPSLNSDYFVVPEVLIAAANTDGREIVGEQNPGLYQLDMSTKNNLWIDEAPALVDALDVLLDLTGDNPLDFSSPTLEDDINKKLTSNITNLNKAYDHDQNNRNIDIVYESLTIQATLAKVLDNSFSNESIISSLALQSIKEGNVYPIEEISALVNSINELNLDLLNESGIDISSIDLLGLNANSTVLEGSSKLDVIYESKIIDFIIYKQLDSKLQGIMKDSLGNTRSLSDNAYVIINNELKYYDKLEISAALDSLNLFEITMSDLNSNILLDKIKNKISNFGEDDVNTIYKSEILRNALSININQINGISIPEEAYVKDSNYNGNEANNVLSITEVNNIITAISSLGISLDNPQFDYIVLDENTAANLSASSIIRATVYKSLSENSNIIIPNTAVSNGNIIDIELETLLNILYKNKNSLYAPEDIDASGKVKIANINVDDATVNILSEMLASEILSATIIYKLPTLGISDIVISDELKAAAAKDNLENNFEENVWKQSELNNLVESLKIVAGNKKFSESDFVSSITTNVTGLTDDKIDTVLASKVVLATVSKTIDNNVSVPGDAFNTESYLVGGIVTHDITNAEIKALLNAANKLGIELDNIDLSSILLTNDTAEALSKSKIIRNTLNEKINNSGQVIIPDKALTNNYISEEECSNLLSILVKYKSSFFTTIDDKVNIESINVDVNKITLEQVSNMTDSLILHATIINELKGVSALVLPDNLMNAEPIDLGNDGFAWGDSVDTYEVKALLASFGVLGLSETSSINSITEGAIIDGLSNLTILNIDTFYKAQIMKATLSSNITNNASLEKPEGAYDPNLSYIKDGSPCKVISSSEVLALSNAITSLDIDLNSPNLKLIKLSNDNSKLIESEIIRGTISNELKKESSPVIVPFDVLDDEGYLDSVELTNVLNLIHDSFATNNVVNLETIAVDTLTVGKIKNFTESKVLSATIIDYVNGMALLSMPYQYRNVDFAIENGYIDSYWNQNTELDKLLTSLELLAGVNTLISNITDVNTLINNINTENSNIIYSSIVLRTTITENIKNNAEIKTPSDAYSEETYKLAVDAIADSKFISSTEFTNLIAAIKALGIDLSTPSFDKIKIVGNSEVISNSVIIRNTIHNNLEASLYIPYDATENGYISYSDCKDLLSILGDEMADEDGYLNTTSIDINNITISKIKNFTSSRVLATTIIVNIKDISPQPLTIPTNYQTFNYYDQDGYNGSIWVRKDELGKCELDKLLLAVEALVGSDTTIDGIGSMSFDSIKVKNETGTYSEMYANSDIIRATISVKLETQLVIPSDSKSDDYIEKSELVKLLDLLTDKFADPSGNITISDIDINNLTINDIIALQTSNVLAATIVTKLVESNKLYMPYEYKDTTFGTGYKSSLWGAKDEDGKNELSKLLDSLATLAGDKKIGGIVVDLDSITESFMANAVKSVVMKTTINEKILDLGLSIPDGAYNGSTYQLIELGTEKKYLSDTEMVNIVISVNELGLNLSSPSFATIALSGKNIANVTASLIVCKQISDTIKTNSAVIIPVSCLDSNNNDMIEQTELVLLLTALQSNNLATDADFASITLDDITDANSIATSVVMRATITKNITIEGDAAYADSADVVIYHKADSTFDCVVLTEQEIKDFITAAKEVCGGSSGLSIEVSSALLDEITTNPELKAIVLESSVMTNIIGILLYNNIHFGTNIDAINLQTGKIENINVVLFNA